MKAKFIIAIGISLIALAFIFSAQSVRSEASEGMITETAAATSTVPATPLPPRFTHAQEVWMAALEWCESRGDVTAVNWHDRDGTPSYYSFQFKPDTFRWLGEKYGVIETGRSDAEIMELMKSHALQKAIVEFMVEDPATKWEQQFPGCTRQLGRPPVIN
jgi:hypothetical protein